MDHLAPLAADFLTHLADRGDQPKTCRRYAFELRHFLTWLDGRDITEARLHAYRRYLQNEKPHRNGSVGMRPRTIHLAFTAIFAFAAWLERTGHVADLPRRGSIALPALDVPQREVPSPEEVRALFAAAGKVGAHARTPQYGEWLRCRALALLALFANCGLRLAEVLALQVEDIRRDREPWVVQVRSGKGAQSRWVPANAEAQRHLRDWLAIRTWWCRRLKRETPALFPVGVSQKLGERGVYNLFGELRALADLTERQITPHGLRHAFASGLLEVTDLKTIQALMGHKSAQTTIEVYLHTSQERMEQAVRDLGAGRPAAPASEAAPAPPAPSRPERPQHPALRNRRNVQPRRHLG